MVILTEIKQNGDILILQSVDCGGKVVFSIALQYICDRIIDVFLYLRQNNSKANGEVIFQKKKL